MCAQPRQCAQFFYCVTQCSVYPLSVNASPKTQSSNWKNSKGHLDIFENYIRSFTWFFLFMLVHKTPQTKIKNAICAFRLQNNTLVCSSSSWRWTQWLTDGLEGQCNWVLEASSSWEMAPCLPLWYLWHRNSFLLQQHWHLRWKKTTHTLKACNQYCGRYEMISTLIFCKLLMVKQINIFSVCIMLLVYTGSSAVNP